MNQPKFIVDLGVGKSVENWIAKEGYDVICVRDLNPRMPDSEILTIADEQSRIVVTMDKDFGELVYSLGKRHSGVLLLRLESASSGEKLEIIQKIFNKYLSELEGSFAVYSNGRLRIRTI